MYITQHEQMQEIFCATVTPTETHSITCNIRETGGGGGTERQRQIDRLTDRQTESGRERNRNRESDRERERGRES